MGDLDIEAYIAAQKEKLIRERQYIQNAPAQQPRRNVPQGEPVGRKRWEPAENADRFISPQSSNTDVPRNGVEEAGDSGLPLGNYEQRRHRLNAERRREYNEQFSPKNGLPPPVPKENIPPRRRPETPEERGLLGGKLGDYEQKRKKLDEERKAEYNRLIAGKNARSGRNDSSAQAYVPSIPGLRESSSGEVRKMQSRNAEYNDFLRQQQEKERHKFDNKKPGLAPQPVPRTVNEAEMASLRVRESDSAELRKVKERTRNDEYNEFLRYKDAQKRKNQGRDDYQSDDERVRHKPRTGWGTPTYEEVLEQKRREEGNYRRQNDPDYTQPMKLGGQNYLRSSLSDGFLNEEKRLSDLDREYERKRVHFEEELHYPNNYSGQTRPLGILDDDLWLSPRTFRQPAGPQAARPTEGSRGFPPQQVNGQALQGPAPSSYQENPSRPRRNPQQPGLGDGEYYATLAVGTSRPGHESTSSAKNRRKEQYRKDLEAQMAELANTKRRERIRDLSDGQSGGQAPPPARAAQPPPVNPPQNYYNPAYPAAAPPQEGPRGILNKGFDFPYGRLPPSRAPPQESYPPSGQGVPPIDLYKSPLDDAYYFYGTRNPLEPELASVPTSYGAPPERRQSHPGQTQTNRVNFDDSPRRVPTRNLNEFPSEQQQRSRSRSEKESYQADLQRQIEEKKQFKIREKQKQEEYDRKKEEEIANYNPYGRGGGGAPMKDRSGNVHADLRIMRRENDDPETPRRQEPEVPAYQPSYQSPRQGYGETSPRQNPEADGFARGGNGLFGAPKTTEEKSATEKYKEELQRQIDEKKRKKAEEEAKIKAEEEKELARLAEEQRKMKEEYEAEQKKQKEKDEEAQRKNEEIKRQAEEKKLEAEKARKEAEDKRTAELRQKQDEESRARQEAAIARNASPPVPAMRTKTVPPIDTRTDSPPIPALRSKTEPDAVSLRGRTSPPVPAVNSQAKSEYRSNSADVLSQLARMRAQLQNERKRVESALASKRDDPDVYDPRINQVQVVKLPRHDDNRPDSINSGTAQEFNQLKQRVSTSRQQFRSLFPESPSTNSQLEAQQIALLRQQEDKLLNMHKESDGIGPSDGRPSPASRLQAETAYIDLESGIRKYPTDFDDLPRLQKNEKARQKRRATRQETPVEDYERPTPRKAPDPMGSATSLDADKITQKNQERLRRLRSLAGDEVSLADPDEVLNRFMAKQDHRRPPSGQTLQDDTWLRADSRN